MTRAWKTLAAMRANPKADWRMAEMETVAAAFGVSVRKSGGSHVVFRAPAGAKLTVPARRPIKPVYVRLFVAFIEETVGVRNG